MSIPLPHTTILMATFNGAAHITAQLDSIAVQDHADWSLWVSDDGSTDDTRKIITEFGASHPTHDIRLIQGPKRGAAANFMSLLCHPDLPDGFVALSDQDDIWTPSKLRSALSALIGEQGVAVYSAQSCHIGQDGAVIGNSRIHAGRPTFPNALVQNRVAGHCATLTPAAVKLLRDVGLVDVAFHDWWIYLLVQGAAGRVIVSDDVVLDYRQHKGNVLGGNQRRFARLARVAMVLGPTFQSWQRRNLTALEHARPHLDDTAQRVLDNWQSAPKFGWGRMRKMAELGIARDTKGATAFLRLAAMFGRI